jgi:hypothetical protein
VILEPNLILFNLKNVDPAREFLNWIHMKKDVAHIVVGIRVLLLSMPFDFEKKGAIRFAKFPRKWVDQVLLPFEVDIDDIDQLK